MWQNAAIGKYYRPLKTPVSLRIDNDVLAWLKSKGEGHISRINGILRERMEQDRPLAGGGARQPRKHELAR
jgi:uncharacterized protein (DUF4415 family)